MKLLICIAFHFKPERLIYLQKILQAQQFLADEVHIVITTNTNLPNELEIIKQHVPVNQNRFKVEIAIFNNLPNPWLLTWAHKVIFAARLQDETYTHFMYTEDDIEVLPINIIYWLRARDSLRPLRLYPSFLRVEWSDDQLDWLCTDLTASVSISSAPKVSFNNNDYHYLNLPNPYQGLFFYDRELMLEHAHSETFDIMRYGKLEQLDQIWGGGVAERANFALTFFDVPAGFTARNVVPYFPKYLMIDPHCLVHHLPNNYANDKINHPDANNIKLRKLLIL